jgi:hypothetical protein
MSRFQVCPSSQVGVTGLRLAESETNVALSTRIASNGARWPSSSLLLPQWPLSGSAKSELTPGMEGTLVRAATAGKQRQAPAPLCGLQSPPVVSQNMEVSGENNASRLSTRRELMLFRSQTPFRVNEAPGHASGGCEAATSRIFLQNLAVQHAVARLFNPQLPVVENLGSHRLQTANRHLLCEVSAGTASAKGGGGLPFCESRTERPRTGNSVWIGCRKDTDYCRMSLW